MNESDCYEIISGRFEPAGPAQPLEPSVLPTRSVTERERKKKRERDMKAVQESVRERERKKERERYGS